MPHAEVEKLRRRYEALEQRGDYQRATPLAERACRLLAEASERPTEALARCINDLGILHFGQGNYEAAQRHHERALSIRQDLLGPDHPSTAESLSNLAATYQVRGDYADAEHLFEQVLSMMEREPSPVGKDIATVASNLGVVYQARGKYEAAAMHFERALALSAEALGPDHPNVALQLNNLGMLDQVRGEYGRAERRLVKAISLWEKSLGSRHPYVAFGHGNLGVVLLDQGKYIEAERQFEMALSIHERTLGPEHPVVAVTLLNLGNIRLEQGDLVSSAKRYERALSLLELVHGREHPILAEAVSRLGSLHEAQGERLEAMVDYERALKMQEELLGPDHPELAYQLHKLARLHVDLGRSTAALALYRRVVLIEDETATQNLVVAEEPRRLSYAATFSASTSDVLSLHLQTMPNHPPSAELALTTLLRRKGRVEELTAWASTTLRRSLPAEHRHVLDDLSTTRAEYAALVHQGLESLPAAELASRLAELQDRQDQLWSTLAQHSSAAQRLLVPVTIAAVQSALPDDAALVELVRYVPRRRGDGERKRNTSEPRYAAYLVFPDRFDWIDLGPANVIDDAVGELRMRLLHEQSVPRGPYGVIMEPIVERLGSIRQVFIAPDAELNRIPFGALHDGERYLIERYSLRFLTTGRDLLRPWNGSAAVDDTVLAVVNPTGAELPGTEREAELLAELFARARILSHDDATETRLRQQARPWMLHMGTHGFHETARPEQDVQPVITQHLRADLRGEYIPPGLLDNPMLRSGLLLTKPDDAKSEDDGRLTAYEVSGWDLRGTELVVLSACGTGLGAVRTGEGVMGLRRAFAMAGTQTQVMSLWDLEDDTTPKVMELYYRKLAAGVGRGEAMQQVQLELLKSENYSHPKHWAAFVVVGEWAPLSKVALPTPEPPPLDPPAHCSCRATVGETRGRGIPGITLLSLLALRIRRRRPSLRSHPLIRSLHAVLWLTLIGTLACSRSSPGAATPPGEPEDAPSADSHTVASWIRGEARRPVPVDARGASLGLQLVAMDEESPQSGATQPGSCGEQLRSLLPLPEQPEVVLLSSADGELLRYAEGSLHPMTHAELPRIGELLGFEAQTSPLLLLVSTLEGNELWELEIGNGRVLTATRSSEGLPFAERETFLASYRTGRCVRGSNACLSLVRDDTQLTLDRRDHPGAEPEILMSLGQAYVADVGYANAEGSQVYLLTAQACEDDPQHPARGSGVVDGEHPM